MNSRFAFFGSSRFSVTVLDELEKAGLIPSVLVTTLDAHAGRGMKLMPNPVKVWGETRGIAVHAFSKLDANALETLKEQGCDVFVVASYGKIIPQTVLDIPPKKTLNIHPSLLPRYRGASPLQSAMLDDAKETGVTLMRIDAEMDHGPIVAQEKVTVSEWPTYEKFEDDMARSGARLLARIMPDWVAGKLPEQEQNHGEATFTKKIKKDDARLDLEHGHPYDTFRKIQAYHESPQAFFIVKHVGKEIRVKVTEAAFENGALSIKKVIPEGKREMSYEDFRSGYKLSENEAA